MRIPSEPVVLTAAQVEELNQKLATLRHDINNHLSLVMAVTELMRHKPQSMDRWLATLAEHPRKITTAMTKFSTQFENAFGITRS